MKRRIWDSWNGSYFKQPMPILNSPEAESITSEERAIIKRWIQNGAAYGVPQPETNARSKAERVEAGRKLFLRRRRNRKRRQAYCSRREHRAHGASFPMMGL